MFLSFDFYEMWVLSFCFDRFCFSPNSSTYADTRREGGEPWGDVTMLLVEHWYSDCLLPSSCLMSRLFIKNLSSLQTFAFNFCHKDAQNSPATRIDIFWKLCKRLDIIREDPYFLAASVNNFNAILRQKLAESCWKLCCKLISPNVNHHASKSFGLRYCQHCQLVFTNGCKTRHFVYHYCRKQWTSSLSFIENCNSGSLSNESLKRFYVKHFCPQMGIVIFNAFLNEHIGRLGILKLINFGGQISPG